MILAPNHAGDAIVAYLTAEEWARIHQDYKSNPGAAKSVMTLCPFTGGSRIFAVYIVTKPRSLQCSCCGGDAGRFAQWHNQDTGYGLCAPCADSIAARGPEYIARHEIDFIATWGVPGVHRAPAAHEQDKVRHV